jgi:hypothetical protein
VYFLLGFIHLFLTWLGVKGPTREHDIHIILFMVITLALLIAECAVGVWSIILWDEVDVESLHLMTDSFNELLNNDFNKKHWFTLESELKCCGFNGPEGYRKKGSVPFSCCDTDLENNATCKTYTNGCQKPLASYAKVLLIDATIMGFSCCVFQALGIFAFYVFLRALKVERAARVQRRLAMQRRISQENGSANPTPSSPPPVTPPTSA